MFGAKLSWCQIVRCQIVLVPNCPGAKLSTFIILVPNCPLLLSWCQIVPFIILVPNCPVPNCPTIKSIKDDITYYITMCAYTAVAWNLNQLMKLLAAFFLPTRSTCFWLGHQISNMNCNNDIDFHDNQGSCKISIICFLCFGTVVDGLWLVLCFMILFVVPTSF